VAAHFAAFECQCHIRCVKQRRGAPALEEMVTDMSRGGKTLVTAMLAWLLIAAMFIGIVPVVRAEPEPVAVLRQMSDYVTDVVRRDTSILKDPVRLRALANEAVLPHVDFVALSRWVLGKHWRKATPAQREDFMTQFREMLMLTYLRNVTSYRETAVRFLPLRAAPEDDRVVVQAEIEPQGAPVVNVMFRMHRVDGRWLIYDVAVEGISLVATHRSGFSQEISHNGLDGLIARLTEMNHTAITAGETCAGC